jgi:hypothetical protein
MAASLHPCGVLHVQCEKFVSVSLRLHLFDRIKDTQKVGVFQFLLLCVVTFRMVGHVGFFIWVVAVISG